MEQRQRKEAELELNHASADSGAAQQANENTQVKREGPKVGRNEPCPCGSGKKYKHCHVRARNISIVTGNFLKLLQYRCQLI